MPKPSDRAVAGARMAHRAMLIGIVVFMGVGWRLVRARSVPATLLPHRAVLYVALALVTGTLVGAALFVGQRLVPPDEIRDGGQANAVRLLIVWALAEAPALFGIVAYLATRDFRTLLATFIGILLFFGYVPGRYLPPP
jgi:hypothetical protein